METGSTGETVVENLARLRKGVTLNELSERTGDAGRKLSVSAISLIATGKRRVDVDDLMALAIALGVSPVTLLMPDTPDRRDPVTATGISATCTAEELWKWLRAVRPLSKPSAVSLLGFIERATPAWRSREYAEGVLQILQTRDGGQADLDGDD